MGLFWAGDRAQVMGVGSEGDYMDTAPGRQAYQRIRLGPSSLWGLVYLTPPLFASGVLIYQFLMFRASTKRPTHRNPAPGSRFENVAPEATD